MLRDAASNAWAKIGQVHITIFKVLDNLALFRARLEANTDRPASGVAKAIGFTGIDRVPGRRPALAANEVFVDASVRAVSNVEIR